MKRKWANDRRSRNGYGKTAAAAMLLILAVLTGGCMYPGDEEQQSQVSYREGVKRIQSAVDDYFKEKSILPIITAGVEVPRYEKFRIDLDKLQREGYIDDIPKTAFEKGGSGYFLIINEETNPTVKVMDLVTAQKVNDVQNAVNRYKTANNGQLPSGEELYPGFHAVDIAKIDLRNFQLKSFYSGQDAALIMDANGKVYVDYAFDIMQAIQKNGSKPDNEKDLRVFLEEESYYVPVKSVPYRWENEQPVAVSE